MAEGCVMVAPGAKGSFPSSTDDATKPKNIIALSNPHTRTTGFQGTRIRMTEPPGTKSGSRLRLLYCEKTRRPFLALSFFFLVVLASSGMRESKFQIGREIHIFCRDVNRYVQTSFAAEISAQFLPRGTHKSAFSPHGHTRSRPSLRHRNRLTEKAGDFIPALEPFVLNSRLFCGATFFGWLLFLLHGDRVQSSRIEIRVHSRPGCRTPRKY